jgi:hypothetical protein
MLVPCPCVVDERVAGKVRLSVRPEPLPGPFIKGLTTLIQGRELPELSAAADVGLESNRILMPVERTNAFAGTAASVRQRTRKRLPFWKSTIQRQHDELGFSQPVKSAAGLVGS